MVSSPESKFRAPALLLKKRKSMNYFFKDIFAFSQGSGENEWKHSSLMVVEMF